MKYPPIRVWRFPTNQKPQFWSRDSRLYHPHDVTKQVSTYLRTSSITYSRSIRTSVDKIPVVILKIQTLNVVTYKNITKNTSRTVTWNPLKYSRTLIWKKVLPTAKINFSPNNNRIWNSIIEKALKNLNYADYYKWKLNKIDIVSRNI